MPCASSHGAQAQCLNARNGFSGIKTLGMCSQWAAVPAEVVLESMTLGSLLSNCNGASMWLGSLPHQALLTAACDCTSCNLPPEFVCTTCVESPLLYSSLLCFCTVAALTGRSLCAAPPCVPQESAPQEAASGLKA